MKSISILFFSLLGILLLVGCGNATKTIVQQNVIHSVDTVDRNVIVRCELPPDKEICKMLTTGNNGVDTINTLLECIAEQKKLIQLCRGGTE